MSMSFPDVVVVVVVVVVDSFRSFCCERTKDEDKEKRKIPRMKQLATLYQWRLLFRRRNTRADVLRKENL
jgi:hypothetical protein